MAIKLGSNKDIAKERVSVPNIAGKTAQALLCAPMRKQLPKNLESFSSPQSRIMVQDNEECACLTFSLILAFNILRQSGTILPTYKLEKLTERVLAQLNSEDVMRLEVEAYDVMEWLGGALGGEDPACEPEPSENVQRLPQGQDFLKILSTAIASGSDLIMWYYTYSTGEYAARKIRPLRVDAEKYLLAYCYKRETERNFRLSRISRLENPQSRPPAPPVTMSATALASARKSSPQNKLSPAPAPAPELSASSKEAQATPSAPAPAPELSASSKEAKATPKAPAPAPELFASSEEAKVTPSAPAPNAPKTQSQGKQGSLF